MGNKVEKIEKEIVRVYKSAPPKVKKIIFSIRRETADFTKRDREILIKLIQLENTLEILKRIDM